MLLVRMTLIGQLSDFLEDVFIPRRDHCDHHDQSSVRCCGAPAPCCGACSGCCCCGGKWWKFPEEGSDGPSFPTLLPDAQHAPAAQAQWPGVTGSGSASGTIFVPASAVAPTSSTSDATAAAPTGATAAAGGGQGQGSSSTTALHARIRKARTRCLKRRGREGQEVQAALAQECATLIQAASRGFASRQWRTIRVVAAIDLQRRWRTHRRDAAAARDDVGLPPGAAAAPLPPLRIDPSAAAASSQEESAEDRASEQEEEAAAAAASTQAAAVAAARALLMREAGSPSCGANQRSASGSSAGSSNVPSLRAVPLLPPSAATIAHDPGASAPRTSPASDGGAEDRRYKRAQLSDDAPPSSLDLVQYLDWSAKRAGTLAICTPVMVRPHRHVPAPRPEMPAPCTVHRRRPRGARPRRVHTMPRATGEPSRGAAALVHRRRLVPRRRQPAALAPHLAPSEPRDLHARVFGRGCCCRGAAGGRGAARAPCTTAAAAAAVPTAASRRRLRAPPG